MGGPKKGPGIGLLLPVTIIALLFPALTSAAGERFLGVQVEAYQQGIVIVGVVQDSPSTRIIDIATGDSMSLEPGDIILSLNNFYIVNPEQFGQLLRAGPPVATMSIWDTRNNIPRVVIAGVGSQDEITAYLNQNLDSTPPIQPAPPTQKMSAAQRKARIRTLDIQIKSLEWKIRDQERSVQLLEQSGGNSPGATNLMAQQAALNLLQEFQRQKARLEMEKAQLESGM